MASKARTRVKKIHLSRPTNERRAMCGRDTNIEETDKPAKVTCIPCKTYYDVNKKWYSAAKRKLTLSKKK